VIAGFLASYHLGNRHKNPEQRPSIAVLLRPPLPLPEFSLIDSSGRPVSQPDLAGVWTLMMTASSCEEAHRQNLARLGDIYNRLAASPELQARISLTPVCPDLVIGEGDSTSAAAPPWRVLSGPPSKLESLLSELGTPSGTGGEDPASLPGTALLVVDPQTRLYAIYSAEQKAESVAHDLGVLIERFASETGNNDELRRR